MDFYKRMELVCRYIPRGKVATYGQIALLCGKPRNARQVGYALSHRSELKNVPAYRIVNSQGFLSGAGAFEMSGQQRTMLDADNIHVDSWGRVDLKRFGWRNTFEDAEFLAGLFAEKGI